MTPRMTRHLLHVGYPKAGSTFLQRWFDAHPQLAHRYGAIAGFRDMHEIAREGATPGQVLVRVTSDEEFSAPRTDAGKTPIDYTQPRRLSIADSQLQTCSMLASLFPNATVLIITRGFRSMILSSLSQYARSGGDVDLPELMRAAATKPDPRMLEAWHYDFLIDAYRRAFGTENVIVMPYELLRDDADAFIETLAARLGIEPGYASRDRVNESLSPAELVWYPRLTRVMRRIPSRRLFTRYIDAALRNRLKHPIALFQRLHRATPFTAADIPDEVLAAFRGRAASLRDHPLYARYAAEYLNE